MVTSETQVVNGAMTLCGLRMITSMDEATEAARFAKANYSTQRDSTLRAGLWSFASWRAQLASLATPVPAHEYSAYFPLPSDYIRLFPMPPDFDYEIEGRYIAANETSLDIKYVRRITDVTLFDPLFVETFQLRLAWRLTFKFTQTTATRQELWDLYLQHLKLARSADAQQKQKNYGPTSWIDARE